MIFEPFYYGEGLPPKPADIAAILRFNEGRA
jgi:hypothetical protein